MSDDPEREVLSIEAKRDRSGVTLSLAGEFDIAGTERFRAFVNEALAAHPKAVTIDTGGLEFIDSSGLQALLHAHDAATEAGRSASVTRRPRCGASSRSLASRTC
jgi:anti-anti-sigma factor